MSDIWLEDGHNLEKSSPFLEHQVAPTLSTQLHQVYSQPNFQPDWVSKMVLLLAFHISLHIEPSSLLVEERKVIKSLFMVHLVVLVLHVCRLQNSLVWMSMGQQVQKLVYRLSKPIIAIRSITEKKVILTNSRQIRIIFIGQEILAPYWSSKTAVWKPIKVRSNHWNACKCKSSTRYGNVGE